MPTHALSLFIILFSLFSSSTLTAQVFEHKHEDFIEKHPQNIFIGDTLYIVTVSGLNVRVEPNTSSNIIAKVNFNEYVIFKEVTPLYASFENRQGQWFLVKTSIGAEGYVFSGFTSKVKFPENLDVECWRIVGFNEILGVDLNAPVSSDGVAYGGHLRANKEAYSIETKYYGNGNSISFSAGYEWSSYTVESYFISTNDVLNYLDYYISLTDKKCGSQKHFKRPEVIIEKGKNRPYSYTIKLRAENGISFSCINVGDKIVVTYGTEYGW
ncbi:MAG: SH3 domain-containing protein [Saprospiraceae bacterium]